MKMNEIMNTIKRLSLSQGFYDRLYHGIREMEVTDPESYDFLVEELEAGQPRHHRVGEPEEHGEVDQGGEAERERDEQKKRAEEALANRQAEMDYAAAEVELAQAIAQLQAIQRLRKHTH